MSEHRLPYDPPVRAGVGCRNCHEEIEATARLIGSLEIQGLHGYEWRHVRTGEPTCTRTYQAKPFDGWHATKQVEAAIEAQRAAEDALEAALEDEETAR